MANPKYERYIYETNASAVLVDKTFNPSEPIEAVLIRVDDVYSSIGQLLSWYETQQNNSNSGHLIKGATPTHCIHDSADISKSVKLVYSVLSKPKLKSVKSAFYMVRYLLGGMLE